MSGDSFVATLMVSEELLVRQPATTLEGIRLYLTRELEAARHAGWDSVDIFEAQWPKDHWAFEQGRMAPPPGYRLWVLIAEGATPKTTRKESNDD